MTAKRLGRFELGNAEQQQRCVDWENQRGADKDFQNRHRIVEQRHRAPVPQQQTPGAE